MDEIVYVIDTKNAMHIWHVYLKGQLLQNNVAFVEDDSSIKFTLTHEQIVTWWPRDDGKTWIKSSDFWEVYNEQVMISIGKESLKVFIKSAVLRRRLIQNRYDIDGRDMLRD